MTDASVQDKPRKARPQVVLQVLEKHQVSPNVVRVRLGGDQLDQLNRNDNTDHYVKLLLPEPDAGLEPPYDMDALREQDPDLVPRRRTYSIRHWDEDSISLDVVVHAADGSLDASGVPVSSGLASQWAMDVQPGDLVAMNGAGGGYSPDPSAPFHLLVVDHSALPAAACALESMQPDARGLVLVHLDHAEDQIELQAPEGVEIRWLVGPREDLVEAVRALELPEGTQAFVHGERGSMKELRAVLVGEFGLPREQLSLSAYWALGRVEDVFQAEKREPIGKID